MESPASRLLVKYQYQLHWELGKILTRPRDLGKIWTKLNIFSPQSPLDFLGLALVTTLINQFSAGNPIGILGVVVVAIIWWLVSWWVARQHIQSLLSGELIVPIEPQPPTGAKCLILLLSPYSPRSQELKDPQKLNRLIEQIINTPLDELKPEKFSEIDLFNSNLMPQVKAVEYHIQQKKLRDVWLITSKSDETGKGSEVTAKILEKYLHLLYGQRLDVHCGEEFSVIDWDYKGLWQLAQRIFRSCGYTHDVVVADITGGTKMMSVALAMACVSPNRRMQYMDSKRDWQGNHLPTGEIKPVVIDVEPIPYQPKD